MCESVTFKNAAGPFTLANAMGCHVRDAKVSCVYFRHSLAATLGSRLNAERGHERGMYENV